MVRQIEKLDLSYLPEGADKQEFDNNIRQKVKDAATDHFLTDTEFKALGTMDLNDQKTKINTLTNDMEVFSMMTSGFSAGIALAVVGLGVALALTAGIMLIIGTPIGGALLLLTSIFATVLAPSILVGGIFGVISMINMSRLDTARDQLDSMKEKFEAQATAS